MPNAVVFITETAELGGGEINLLTIAKALRGSEFVPTVIVPYRGPLVSRLDTENINSVVVPLGRTYSSSFFVGKSVKLPNPFALLATLAVGIRWCVRLQRWLSQNRPDIVQTMSLWAHVFGGFAAHFADLPVILHMQQLIERSAGFGLYRRAFNLFAQHLPDRILCISDVVAQQFKDHGVKTNVIYNAIDDAWFSEPQMVRNLENDRLMIGTVARLTRWKGHDVALQVAARLNSADIPFLWQIAGSETLGESGYREYLLREIERLNLQNSVQLCGWIDTMRTFYDALDVLVHLPTSPEPYGLTLSEALASGLPVITTAGGGMSQHIRAANGCVVAPKSVDPVVTQLQQWWQAPEERACVGDQGRHYAAEHFRLATFTQKLTALYATLS